MKFSEWVRMTRGAHTQASCAQRAGMTPQQWNQIEKQVRLPSAETVKRVAFGLCVEETVALHAAGYDTTPDDIDIRIGQRLGPIVMQAPPSNRYAVEMALENVARTLVGAIAAPNM